GNFLKVYLVIKLWYFLIVSSGFFESGCVQHFFIKRNKLYNLDYSRVEVAAKARQWATTKTL
ncbi:MAG: hypothetical protein KAT01_08250, partial [Candidatus Aminicenantes bacterium]|nr:hypothetical protein [Candidatus Aminicenantes bacterium]